MSPQLILSLFRQVFSVPGNKWSECVCVCVCFLLGTLCWGAGKVSFNQKSSKYSCRSLEQKSAHECCLVPGASERRLGPIILHSLESIEPCCRKRSHTSIKTFSTCAQTSKPGRCFKWSVCLWQGKGQNWWMSQTCQGHGFAEIRIWCVKIPVERLTWNNSKPGVIGYSTSHYQMKKGLGFAQDWL